MRQARNIRLQPGRGDNCNPGGFPCKAEKGRMAAVEEILADHKKDGIGHTVLVFVYLEVVQ